MYNFNKPNELQNNTNVLSAYGDTLGDSKVQVSFTLPIADTPQANVAAITLANKMGLTEVDVVYKKAMRNFTFYILYGKLSHTINLNELPKITTEKTEKTIAEIDELVMERFHRKLVIVGATTGTDAHTVGLDAILNRKGFGGVPGLESYQSFEVHNLGGQVDNADFIQAANNLNADILLISQTVTQKDVHIHNLTDLIHKLGNGHCYLKICGGAKITDELAKRIGFDKGFGRNTFPNEVANFIVSACCK